MGNKRRRKQNQLVATTSRSSPPANVTQAVLMSRSGPIPDPDTLERYEQIHPGAAKLILDRFELEGNHRHAMENRAIEADIADMQADRSEAKLGQWLAFIVTIAAFAVVVVAIIYNQPWVASFLGGTTLVALVTAFLIGRKRTGEIEHKEPVRHKA